jgi:hypothetical protein
MTGDLVNAKLRLFILKVFRGGSEGTGFDIEETGCRSLRHGGIDHPYALVLAQRGGVYDPTAPTGVTCVGRGYKRGGFQWLRGIEDSLHFSAFEL